MSVLMFVDAAGDGRWPSAYSVNRFRSKSATDVQSEGHRPTTVFAYRQPESLLVDAVAREFALSTCRGHRIRVVLIGVQDPQLAELLYQERGLPVNVVFSTPEVDDRWFGVLGPLPGITMSAWQGWRPTMLGDDDKNDDEDVVSLVVDVINTLCDDYRSYMVGLRDVPSFATHLDASSSVDNGSVYATIMDTFGEGVQAVEPVLDAMLEQLCGATESDDNDDEGSGGRWMPTIVEYGDKAAEYASYLLNHGQCTAEAAVDFKLRTERLVTSFVSSYWRNVACRSTTTDRALSDCLVANLQFTANSTKLGDLSVGQFAMCLNAKFIASRRWDQLSAPGRDVPRVRLFRPEIREPCERFTGVQHLLDLTATGDDDVDDRVFGSSHVEHMEPYVMTQRVVEYASRYCRHQVRYFALTDTLVFKFTDGAPGDLIEKHYNHRFAGPKDFRDFHFELFNTAEFFRHDDNDGDSNHPRLPADDYPNAFVYREFGYSDMDNNIMNYVSVNGETTVCVESYRLNGTSQISGDNCDLKYEQRNRVKVKFGKFWLAVHGIGTSAVELTVGLHDGAMITVTTSKYGDRVFHDEGFDVVYRRTDSGFQVYEGDVQYTWPDGRPLLVCDYPIVEVEAADGTKTIVDFVNSVCRVHVSDGAKLRVRFCTASGVEFCHPGAAITNIGDGGPSSAGRQHCKYLVCRRDMSGYEFVESDQSSAWPPHAASVIRTLTRSCFDGQTSRLVNELLIDYLKTDEMLAYQLNAEFSEDSESGLEKSSQIDEEECWGGSGVFDF